MSAASYRITAAVPYEVALWILASEAEIEQLREALDAADWYCRCLVDVLDGRVVRGLGEAKAGYDTAREALRGEQ